MKRTGMKRSLDRLGRIVLPKEMRDTMEIHIGDPLEFFIEGKEQIASAGDVLHFPSNCWHGATMMDEEVVLIDIFSPLREDFLNPQITQI